MFMKTMFYIFCVHYKTQRRCIHDGFGLKWMYIYLLIGFLPLYIPARGRKKLSLIKREI